LSARAMAEPVAVADAVPVITATAMVMPGVAELASTPYDPEKTHYDGKIFYEVFGEDMQILHVKLNPGETVQSIPGAMLYTQPGISPSVDCNNACGRVITGHSCIFPSWTNKGSEHQTVAFSPNIPAKVIPVPVKDGMKVRSKERSFLAGVGQVKLSMDVDCNPATACFGGQGCVRQTIGGDGVGFLAAMGTIMTKTLEDGEQIHVDTNSLVAWDETVTLSIVRASKGCCGACCGGEGFFNTQLTGPGRVFLQSYSYEKFKTAMLQYITSGNTKGAPGAPEPSEEMDR